MLLINVWDLNLTPRNLQIDGLIGIVILLRAIPSLLTKTIRTSPKAPLLYNIKGDPVLYNDSELISRFRPGISMTTINESGETVEFRPVIV